MIFGSLTLMSFLHMTFPFAFAKCFVPADDVRWTALLSYGVSWSDFLSDIFFAAVVVQEGS